MIVPDETLELLQVKEPRDRFPDSMTCGYTDNRNCDYKSFTWILFSIMGGLIYGYNVSLAATLAYICNTLSLSSKQAELLSATATFSDACSMLVGGCLADRFGRKATAMFACICSIIGALLAGIASSNFYLMLLWRLGSGVGNGLSILLLPMYISECVDTTSRGSLLTLFQLGVNAGVAVPYFFMIFISEDWRACLAFGSLPALCVLYNFHFHFSESIVWLRWKENVKNEATNVFDEKSVDNVKLATIHNKSTRNKAYHRPEEQDDAEVTEQSLMTSLTSSDSSRELLIGLVLAYVNNCVDASLFYGPEVVGKTIPSYSSRDANIFGLLCSLVAVVSVLFAGRFVITKFSRRHVYLTCLAVVCGCFVVSGGIFARYSADDFAHNMTASASIAIIFALLNVFAAVGPSILFVTILSELFHDKKYRARYMSYCTFAMSLISLLMNGSMLTLFETFGTATIFLAYGTTYLICLFFCWAYLPETKQRQLL